MKRPSLQNHGFSLVEALVAIAILLTVISGVMLLVNQSIRTGQDISNRLAASYLASDAIEYLRYERDTKWLADGVGDFNEWVNNDLPDCEKTNITCKVDTRKGAGKVTECNNKPCENLKYNSSEYVYGYDSSWGKSKFTRKVEFIGINDLSDDDDNDSNKDDELIVEVTVTWPQTGGDTGELVLTDTLSSWGD